VLHYMLICHRLLRALVNDTVNTTQKENKEITTQGKGVEVWVVMRVSGPKRK
jgi:hypothetical protein